jgi:signal transduction histidine kinase
MDSGYPARVFIGVTVGAAALALFLPGAAPSADPVYAPLGAALLLGSLLVVRLRPDDAGTPLLFLPAIVAEARFGAAALPALAFATLCARLARQRRVDRALVLGTSIDILAFAAAHYAAASTPFEPTARLALFAVVFPLTNLALWLLARQTDAVPRTASQAGPPDLLLSIALAPLAALPLLAGALLGDGGLTLMLAILFAVLVLVVEARNLATARSEAEAERARLARVNDLQRDLFHLMTHELKTPLTSMLVYAQLIDKAVREHALERLPGHTSGIQRGARGIQRLVDNLLELSRLDESTELPPPEYVDLRTLTREVVSDLELLASNKGQVLSIDIPDSIPKVLAPAILLREALSNLISNAVKYTPEGGEVRVWALARAPERDIVVCVTDNGIGLSVDDLEHLFTRFFRSSNPRARVERGSGLGLALTQAIISRIGGRIEVESTLNSGTTFRVVLPVSAR